MPHYRAYIIDEDGELVSGIDFNCADDEEAKEHARALDGRRVELWRELSLEAREGGDANALSIIDDEGVRATRAAHDLRRTSLGQREVRVSD